MKGFRLNIMLIPPAESIIRQPIRTVKLTNNKFECVEIIAGQELAKSLSVELTEAKCDSILVVNQVNETFEVKEEWMRRYLEKLHETLHQFKEWTLQLVPLDQNSEADTLANLGLFFDSDEFTSSAVLQLISEIEERHIEVNLKRVSRYWRNEDIDYLKLEKFPSDPKESRALRTKATRFYLDEGALFKISLFDPLARFVKLGEIEYAMREVYEGTCGNHLGVESLVQNLIRAGYYWNEIEKDAK